MHHLVAFTTQFCVIAISAALLAGCGETGIKSPQPIEGFLFAHSNAEEGLRKWLKSGGSPHSLNNDGSSLLLVATGPKGGSQVVQVLLSAGANPNIGRGRFTPLMNAASWANAESVELLLAAGADPTLVDESGRTALQQVGQAGGREQRVVELLIKAQASK